MSGFAGIVRLEPTAETAEADRAAISRMAEAIAFRGPDKRQQWTQGGASFAFSLLTTGPAPQAAAQPVTLDGETWIIGDVRIDRREELIKNLCAADHVIPLDIADEQIVLFAWKQYRERGDIRVLRQQLHGDFSFAIWEPGRGELNCFRDVMGCRPFYYCASKGVFSFSNTLNALQSAAGFTAELDREFIGDFLLVGWCPRAEHTVYQSTRRLPAGHWLTFSSQGVRVQRFQQLPVEEPLRLKHQQEYVEAYRELLDKAVADRLPRGAASIFLSGGMDSGTIAATVCTLRKKAGIATELYAFTADSQPLFDDQEGVWAQTVANHLNLPFDLSHHGDSVPFSGFESSRHLFPEPVANPFRALYLDLYRRCAAKAHVVFLGYGGDDVLTGQTWPYLIYLAKHARFGRALSEFAGYAIARKRLPPLRAGIRSRVLRAISPAPSRPPLPLWLAPEFQKELCLSERWKELNAQPTPVHPIHVIGYRGLTGTFWPQSLDNEDAAFIGLPIEFRLPLFDYRLLCFVLSLPPIPWCVDKEIMRRAMRERLPEIVLHRKKQTLAQDPLVIHEAHERDWRARSFATAADRISEFVNWPVLLKDPSNAGVTSQWTDVAAIALNLWLKSIEKHKSID